MSRSVKKQSRWSKRVWVGFCDGRPDYRIIDTGWGGWGNGGYRTIIVFTNRARARREYQDVRPMELRAVMRQARTG